MSVPLARVMIVAASIGGGIALDRYLLPHPPSGGAAHTKSEGKSAAATVLGANSEITVSGNVKPFAGGVAELIRFSRQINDYQRAQLKLFQLLEGTPAADLARLTKEFPWRANLPWQENVVSQTLLDRWAE